ncbi:MAG TPA: hydrogenase maturation nickel metallochaperone HypA, partial [Euryarchaeota archaeon]|nr:hydrogenase maturation nickel metallochaperone HypA [Euryarchaeota archaeon]
MHEFSVMERTVRRILERLNGENYERVLKVRMVVGELTHLSEEQMKFSFQVLTKGTPLEGSV